MVVSGRRRNSECYTPRQPLRLYQGEEEEEEWTFVAPHQKILRIKAVVWGEGGDDILELSSYALIQ